MFTRFLLFSLVVVIVLFQSGAFSDYRLQKDISTQLENQNGTVLSRKRRYLVFPAGSSFQLVFCLTYPSLGVGSYFVFGHTAALAWELPSTPLYYNGKDFTKKAEEEKPETTTLKIPHDIDLESLSHGSDYSDRIGTNSGPWSVQYENNDQKIDFGYTQWNQKQPYSVKNNPFLNLLQNSPLNSQKTSYSWNNDHNRRVQDNHGMNYGKNKILQPFSVKNNPFLNFLQNSQFNSQKTSESWNNYQNQRIQDNNYGINSRKNGILQSLPLNSQKTTYSWNNDQNTRTQEHIHGRNYEKNRTVQSSPINSQKTSYNWNIDQNIRTQDNIHGINYGENRTVQSYPINSQKTSFSWNNGQNRRLQNNNNGIKYDKNRKNYSGRMKSYSNSNSFKRYNSQKSQLNSHIDPVFYPVHRRTRRDLYKKIENFLTALNLDGKVCILKAICEVTQSSKEKGSFVEEIIKTIFRVKPHDDFPNEDHYDHAVNHTHNCDQMYPTCKGSIWTNLFLLQK